MGKTTGLPIAAIAAIALGFAQAASAQQAQPSYGAPLTLENAKKIMAAAEAEARKNNWNMVISIIDSGGNLVGARHVA